MTSLGLWQALWNDDRLIGASDAGAHLDSSGDIQLLHLHVGGRSRSQPLEFKAVNKLTDVPARLYGLKERGRVEEGWWADLVVFDAAEVAPAEIEVRGRPAWWRLEVV